MNLTYQTRLVHYSNYIFPFSLDKHNCQYRYNHSNTHSLSQQLIPTFFHINYPKSKTAFVFLLTNKNLTWDRVLLLNLQPGKKKAEQRVKNNIYSANELCEVWTLHRPIYLKRERAEWQMESARAFMRRMKIKLAIMLCRRRCNEGWTQRCLGKQWRVVKLLCSCSTERTKL